MEEGSGYFLGKCWVCGLIALIRDCLDAILRTFPRRAEIQEPGSLENGGRHSSRLSSNLVSAHAPVWFVWYAFQEMGSNRISLEIVLSRLVL